MLSSIGAIKFKSFLDCKWKLLDSNSREKNYKISFNDMCQLYAYGNKYLKGRG